MVWVPLQKNMYNCIFWFLHLAVKNVIVESSTLIIVKILANNQKSSIILIVTK